jgi:hypothetical protein
MRKLQRSDVWLGQRPVWADLDDSFRKAGGAIPVTVATLPPSADV